MLTVAKVTSSAAKGYAAYLDGRTRAPELGDYYLKDGERIEAPGRWVAGADAIGGDPGRAVSSDQLHALMAVRHPDTGLPLRRVGGNGEAVCAIDATFSAPKSVSAVWALASPQLRAQLEHAHEHAVDHALAYATQRIPMIRERVDKKRVIHATARQVIATSWRHTTARAVADQPPDPQLHSHVLLHGAVRHDGQIVAIDSRAWFVHRRELGAAYRTELAHQLTRLGFQIERGTGRGGRYFEIEGVPQALLDRWSSRHHQVQSAIEARLADKQAALQTTIAAGGPNTRAAAASLDALARSGRLMPAEERYMASHTRAPKSAPQTHGDLDRRWYQTAHQLGLDSRSVEALRTTPQPLEAATDRELLDRLTEFDATFAGREARAVALEASAGIQIERALRRIQRLQATGELLRLADGRHTTRRHRTAERHTVTTAARLAAARLTPLPTRQVTRQTLALDAELNAHGGELSAEQRQALALGCSDRQLVIIEGHAGTGKSTTLTAIARAHQTDRRQIIVTSTSALAAQRLAAELHAAGVTATAHSTVALGAAVDAGTLALGPDTTIIHDEAALASTREQQRLLAAVEASGARLIAVGDPRQSQAVGAGGLWADLEQHARANGAHVRLTRIVRATDPADRRDQTLFRAGQRERALHGYAARDRVHLETEQRQAEDNALDAAHADRRADRRTIIIAQTSNEHLDELNARAQAIRHQHQDLGDHALPLTGRPYRLRAGDHIQLRHPIEHDELGRIPNGTTGQVLDVPANQQEATLRLSDGREARFTQTQADEASVRLAYVQHPFCAQGQTTDTTHLIVSEHSTQEGCYVALTRARHATHIHASHHQPEQPELWQPPDQDPLVVLAERMGRTEPELASIRTPLAHEQHITRQHEHELATDSKRTTPQHDGERDLAQRLGRARAELDDAKQVMAGYPAAHARQNAYELEHAQRAAQAQADHHRRADRLRDELDQLGPFARRGESARELKQQLASAQAMTERLREDDQRLREEATEHMAIVEQWTAQHPDARERLHAAEHAHDELVDQQAHRRLEHPGEHLTLALGPEPDRSHPTHQTWRQGALQIERYRTRYQIDPAEPTALGPEPELGHYEQRKARDNAAEHALQTLARLGRPVHELGPIQERIQNTPHLARPAPGIELDRGLGLEL
jgi:conjugative relaxase-like TrwC/TraI family protein